MRLRHGVPLAVLLALATGCSGGGPPAPSAPPPPPAPSQPPAAAFVPGTCATVAPAVLEIGRDARLLGDAPVPPPDVRERIKLSQDALRAAQPMAVPPYRADLDALVIAIGYARLRSDTGNYTPDLGAAVMTAYDDLVVTCTTPAA